jgi:hypothetical protein
MSSAESAPQGPEEGPEACSQAAGMCLQGLLARARTVADSGESIELHPVLMEGLDQAVAETDEINHRYVLACQTAACDIKYAVGNAIEPRKL